jgi:hypothetical protein
MLGLDELCVIFDYWHHKGKHSYDLSVESQYQISLLEYNKERRDEHMYRLLSVASLIVVLSACAPSIMVSTQRDVNYQLNKDVPLYLELKNDVSVSEKNTYNLLQSALARSGFKMVNRVEDAQLVLAFSDKQEQHMYESYSYGPSYYGGWYGGWGWPSYYSSPYWESPYPRVYLREEKVVRLRLFEGQNYRTGKRVPLWEGSVWGDSGTLASRLQQSLDVLVEKIGVDYRGRVRLHEPS